MSISAILTYYSRGDKPHYQPPNPTKNTWHQPCCDTVGVQRLTPAILEEFLEARAKQRQQRIDEISRLFNDAALGSRSCMSSGVGKDLWSTAHPLHAAAQSR